MRLPTRTALSPEQEEIFLQAPLDGCVLIEGPPGTGKTVMAVYRAHLLKKKNKRFKVVMFNHVLRSYTSLAMEGLEEHVATWHSWVSNWWYSSYRKRFPSQKPWVYQWDKAIAHYLTQEPQNEAALDWGHLIVDEGQDFPPGFYVLCNLMVNHPRSGSPSVTILADENQRLNADLHSSLRQIKETFPGQKVYRLTKNFRNTRQIAELAQTAFFVGNKDELPELPDRRGPIPELRKFPDQQGEAESIAHYAKNNEDQSIGVFLPTTALRERYYRLVCGQLTGSEIRVQQYRSRRQISDLDLQSDRGITLLCDMSCKGLEFDVVFIPNLQHFRVADVEEDLVKMKFYVMSTRARNALYFSFSESGVSPAVVCIFPPSGSGLLKIRNME